MTPLLNIYNPAWIGNLAFVGGSGIAVPHSISRDNTPQTTTLGTFQDGLIHASSNFVVGRKYLIMVCFDYLLSGLFESEVKVRHGTTDFADSLTIQEGLSFSSWQKISYFVVWTAISGESINIQFRKNPAGGTITIDNQSIFALEISELFTENTDWHYTENNTVTVQTSAEKIGASLTFTPPVAGDDWLIMSRVRFGNYTVSGEDQLARQKVTSFSNLESVRNDPAISDTKDFDKMRVYNLPASSHTVEVGYDNDFPTGDHLDSKIFAINLSKFVVHVANSTDVDSATLGTTNFGDEIGTLAITPDQVDDVWFGEWTVFNNTGFANEDDFMRTRNQIDNVDNPLTQTADLRNFFARTDFFTGNIHGGSQYGQADSLSVAAHNFDVDSSANIVSIYKRDQFSIFAVQLRVPTPPVGDIVPHSVFRATSQLNSTSTAFVDAGNLASTNFVVGRKYLIMFTADGNMESTNQLRIRARHGTTEFVGSEASNEGPLVDDTYNKYAFFVVWTAVSGENVTIQFAHGDGVGTAVGIANRQIFSLEISEKFVEGTDWHYNENAVFTSYNVIENPRAAITFTPDNAGDDWLFLGYVRSEVTAEIPHRINRLKVTGKASLLTTVSGEDLLDRDIISFMRVYNLPASSHTCEMTIQTDTGASNDHTHSAIFAINLSKFAVSANTNSDTQSAAISTTNYATEDATISITPDNAGDDFWFGAWLTWSQVNQTTNAAIRIRTQIDNVDNILTQTADASKFLPAMGSVFDETIIGGSLFGLAESQAASLHDLDLDVSADSATGDRFIDQRSLFAVQLRLAA